MIVDVSELEAGHLLEADVCIVGAGAAGITLALSLAESGVSVLLVESGGWQAEAKVQALYAGGVSDERMHSPPDKYRQRRFGGSTTIWGGRCMPFDPIDFETRAWIPNSGWPIGFEQVAPFYAGANALCEAGANDYRAGTALAPDARPMIEGLVSDVLRSDGLERFSCPSNFADRYRARLEQATHVRVLLGGNCTGIRLDGAGRTVIGLDFSTLEGKIFAVRARHYALAVGGIETARLLLASRDVQKNGVGNDHDVVGRYYMCHMAGNIGVVAVNGPTTRVHHGYDVSPDGIYCRRRLALTEAKQRELEVGNVVARLHFPRIADPSHGLGVLSGLYLVKGLISYEYGKRLNDSDVQSLGNYARHFRNIISDPFDTFFFLWHWLRKRTLAERKFPSVILKNKNNRFSLDVHAEQEPNVLSRITLGERCDALGMPEVMIDWRYTEGDIRTVQKTLATMGAEFRRTGVGSIEVDESRLEHDLLLFGAYGGHHIGTARMGWDPLTSVVDADCRVHGINNLFVSGSAVFPTSGQANPTLTIVALALRLGEHLAGQLKENK